MSRCLKVSVACLVVACAVLPAVCAEDAREMIIIASAQDSPRAANIGPVQLNDYGGVVIRSAEDLVTHSSKPNSAKDYAVQKEMTVELAKLLEVDAIDWSKQMVLAVRGVPGTKADRVHFDSLRRRQGSDSGLEGQATTAHAGTERPSRSSWLIASTAK